MHVQKIGIGGANGKRPYGLPAWVSNTDAAKRVKTKYNSLLLPMAYTPGSPAHPAYGAGHATVAGACVTILKAFFKTFDTTPQGNVVPVVRSVLADLQTPVGAFMRIAKDSPYAFLLESVEGGEASRLSKARRSRNRLSTARERTRFRCSLVQMKTAC